MSRMLLAATAAGLALVACSDDHAAPPATSIAASGNLVCDGGFYADDLPFETEMTTCEGALVTGRRIVDPEGRANEHGQELLFVSLCTVIQSGQPTTASRESIAQAEELVASGVCTGDPSILTPSD